MSNIAAALTLVLACLIPGMILLGWGFALRPIRRRIKK